MLRGVGAQVVQERRLPHPALGYEDDGLCGATLTGTGYGIRQGAEFAVSADESRRGRAGGRWYGLSTMWIPPRLGRFVKSATFVKS